MCCNSVFCLYQYRSVVNNNNLEREKVYTNTFSVQKSDANAFYCIIQSIIDVNPSKVQVHQSHTQKKFLSTKTISTFEHMYKWTFYSVFFIFEILKYSLFTFSIYRVFFFFFLLCFVLDPR